MEITKREIIASISILAILLIIGTLISDAINDHISDKNAKYTKALKIDDANLFKYAMKTGTGNAFVEGEMQTIEPVTFDDIKEEYLFIKKVTEKYTRHTRTVTYKVNGKMRTRTEVYWTWDTIHVYRKQAKEVTFLGSKFNSNQFDLPESHYITTVPGGFHLRYKYYGLEPQFKATIFCNLKDNNISKGKNKVDVMKDKTKEEAYEQCVSDSKASLILFWLIWIVLSAGLIYQFVYAENDWLNKD